MPNTPNASPDTLTLAEANAALPKVRELLEQLQELGRAIVESQQHQDELAEKLGGGNGHSQTDLEDQLYAGAARHDQLMAEAEATFTQLSDCGAMLKDLESGLIDFYGKRDGEVVLLCWRLGEEMRIEYWHTLEGGFAGRQPADGLIK